MTNTLAFRGLLPAFAVMAALSACSDKSAPAVGNAPGYAAISRGRVEVEGGLLPLSLPGEGALAKVAVREGDHVERGQVLAALDTEGARLAVSAAQAGLAQAKAQVELYSAELATARIRADRLADAAEAGAGDRQSADDARGAVAQLRAELQGASAAASAAEVKLHESRLVLERRTLRAPVAGTVVRMTASVGASVSPQSGALFTLLPQRPLIVRAELSEMYVGAVHPGMPASVVLDDDRTSSGIPAHVARIGAVFGISKLEDDPALRENERTVTCILTFDTPPALRVGQWVLVRYGAPVGPPH